MNKLTKCLLSAVIGMGVAFSSADACSRFTYADDSGSVITARSMDWAENFPGGIHVFKRGAVRKNYAPDTVMLEWTAKYGSVGMQNLGVECSAVNEKGLVVDLLWLGESDYGTCQPGDTAVPLNQVEQYLLDNCANVEEVVKCLQQKKIRPVLTEKEIVSGVKAAYHFLVTDKSGNNAVIEWIDGKLKIHRQKGKIVMTNDPSYDKMLAIRDYYREIGIENSMPGSSLSQARFVFIDGWLNQLQSDTAERFIAGITEQSLDNQKILSALSVIRGVSTPVGVPYDKDHPNNSTTIWRTIVDLKNKKFYYDSALAMTTVWVDINKIDFSKEKHLTLSDGRLLHGDVTDLLQEE